MFSFGSADGRAFCHFRGTGITSVVDAISIIQACSFYVLFAMYIYKFSGDVIPN